MNLLQNSRKKRPSNKQTKIDLNPSMSCKNYSIVNNHFMPKKRVKLHTIILAEPNLALTLNMTNDNRP
jgi:hypothetical protein